MKITEMTKEQKEEYKKLKEQKEKQIRRQNKYNKENYDRISATLPKGTVDRIKALGMTINGAINTSLIAYLKCAEEESGAEPKEETQTATISPTKEEREEIINTPTKVANRADKKPFDIYVLQAELDAKRANMHAPEKPNKNHDKSPEEIDEIMKCMESILMSDNNTKDSE